MSADAVRPWLERWRLNPDGEVVRTPTALVQFVRRGEERLVLKLITHTDEASQPGVLEHYGGHGAVRLFAHADGAMLMEHAWPGRPLSELALGGHDDEATGVVAGLIAELHWRPAPSGARTVEDWGRGFDRIRPSALAAGADPDLIDRAGTLYRELCASQGRRVLLHGDLHHHNILFDDGRGWLAIDPKGVAGELAFETGAILRNPGPDPAVYADPKVIARRTGILAERLGLERERIHGWCFVQAVLSALWQVEDGLDATLAWQMAAAARGPL